MTNSTTATATATEKISARVLALVATGLEPVDALRAVVGAGLVDAMIDNLYRELRTRESAAPNLRGIPARQNQTSVDRLYDELNALHIQRIEGGQ